LPNLKEEEKNSYNATFHIEGGMDIREAGTQNQKYPKPLDQCRVTLLSSSPFRICAKKQVQKL
jgi:hypothetical protein